MNKLQIVLPDYVYHPPYISSYLALIPVLYAYKYNLYDISISYLLIWVTSIFNHSNYSNSFFWRTSDLIVVHSVQIYYALVTYAYMPLYPYKIIVFGSMIIVLCIFYLFTGKNAIYYNRITNHDRVHSLIHIIGYITSCVAVHGFAQSEYIYLVNNITNTSYYNYMIDFSLL